MTLIDLYVNSFSNVKTGWTRVGASPYLDAQDQPTNYIYDNVKKAQIGDFGFEDTTETGTINSVTLNLYFRTNDKYGITVYLWDGAVWNELTNWRINTGGAWQWTAADVTSLLNTWEKINGAQIYIASPNTAVYRYVDAAYIQVDYTPAAPITEVSFSDVGAGSDGFANPFRAMGFSDVGAGSDGFANPFRAMQFTDLGTGSDVFFLLQEKSFSDAGQGSDAFTKETFEAILKEFFDAGLGTDVFVLTPVGVIEKSFLDSGSGIEQFSKKSIMKAKLPAIIGMTLDGKLVIVFKRDIISEA